VENPATRVVDFYRQSNALTFCCQPINVMGMGAVQPLRLSDAGFLKKLRGIAGDSNRVVLAAAIRGKR
jgi:hypothetical protein